MTELATETVDLHLAKEPNRERVIAAAARELSIELPASKDEVLVEWEARTCIGGGFLVRAKLTFLSAPKPKVYPIDPVVERVARTLCIRSLMRHGKGSGPDASQSRWVLEQPDRLNTFVNDCWQEHIEDATAVVAAVNAGWER